MTKAEKIKVCLNCKFPTCQGAEACPVLKLAAHKKSVKVSVLEDLLRAGYDPAEICFAIVEGGTPV